MNINELDERTQQQIRQRVRETGCDVRLAPRAAAPALPTAVKRPRRIDGIYRSKLERDFAVWLEDSKADLQIARWRYEPLTFRLANGVRYTPDFVTTDFAWQLRCYEVKGPYCRDDARIKLRVAAAQFTEIEWFLATRPDRSGPWLVERVDG